MVNLTVGPSERKEVQAAARALGLDLVTFEVREAADITSAFDNLKNQADALFVSPEPLVFVHRVRVNTLALGQRLPPMHGIREYVESGGLMSYGANISDLFGRSDDYVDNILRGAKPSDACRAARLLASPPDVLSPRMAELSIGYRRRSPFPANRNLRPESNAPKRPSYSNYHFAETECAHATRELGALRQP